MAAPPKPYPAAAATAAATVTAAAAATVGSNSMADFDTELSDRVPPAANVLKPFDDPLGLL